MSVTTVRVAVGVAAAAAATVVAARRLVLAARELVGRWSDAPMAPEEALTVTAAVGALGVATWLAGSMAVAVLAHVPGALGRVGAAAARHVAPAPARRLAALLAGAGLVGGLAPAPASAVVPGNAHGAVATVAGCGGSAAGPAFQATTCRTGWGRHSAAPAPLAAAPAPLAAAPSAAPSGPGWVPHRPLVRPHPSPALLTAAPPRDGGRTVVVRRGDTLWDIVQRHLGPDAADTEVADQWPRWHEANRAVIGDDANLLLPGQLLRPPSAAAGSLQSGAAR